MSQDDRAYGLEPLEVAPVELAGVAFDAVEEVELVLVVGREAVRTHELLNDELSHGSGLLDSIDGTDP
jgi:hypothetical protein